ncbi:MAG: hypothetical protein GF335_00700 [Candidatus Moranbacteria bacterium]|nr:hypothetical protein [Candidatus Moranbacteria bacterium]
MKESKDRAKKENNNNTNLIFLIVLLLFLLIAFILLDKNKKGLLEKMQNEKMSLNYFAILN